MFKKLLKINEGINDFDFIKPWSQLRQSKILLITAESNQLISLQT
jgi:hypothetical protein